LLAIAYVFAAVLFFPGSILTLGAGFAFKQAYGSAWQAVLIGTAAVWIGASVGAAVAMILGRFVLKDWVTQKSEKFPILKAIQAAIRQEGLKLIFLLRLCPVIPFNFLNYMMGITEIKLSHFCIGSIGMLPGTIVYVFIGTTISSITEAASGSTNGENNTLILVLFIVGSVLACGGIIWVSVVAKKHLNAELEKAKFQDTENPIVLEEVDRSKSIQKDDEDK